MAEAIDPGEDRHTTFLKMLDDLHKGCVFDVQTTGDPELVKGYLLAQEVRRLGTAVQLVADKPRTRLMSNVERLLRRGLTRRSGSSAACR